MKTLSRIERISSISNLKRLNFKLKKKVGTYLLKKILHARPNEKENEVYRYYNFLIKFDGYLIEESDKYFISKFRNNKTIKLRRFPSSDLEVFQQVYFWEAYKELIKIFEKYYPNIPNYNVSIIDAGSNIGLTALYFLDHFKRCNIICVEPDVENFKVLNSNVESSNEQKISKINGAIWSKKKKLSLINDFRDRLDWAKRVVENGEKCNVQAYSINDLVRDYNLEKIDILKIDVEGAEKEIFTSEYTCLDFLEITNCIAIEIHDEFKCRNKIYAILKDYNFDYYSHGELTIGFKKVNLNNRIVLQ